MPPSGTAPDQADNVKASYALLLSAIATGARIAIYGGDGATAGNLCVVTSISVLAN